MTGKSRPSSRSTSRCNVAQAKSASKVNLTGNKSASKVNLIGNKSASKVNLIGNKSASKVTLTGNKSASKVNVVPAKPVIKTKVAKPSSSKGVKRLRKNKRSYKKGLKNNNVFAVKKLSPALARVLGGDRMRNCDVVKRMWEIIKERGLKDPRDPTYMICDNELLPFFGQKRIKIITMMKYLSKHMSD